MKLWPTWLRPARAGCLAHLCIMHLGIDVAEGGTEGLLEIAALMSDPYGDDESVRESAGDLRGSVAGGLQGRVREFVGPTGMYMCA